jgi:hypothetical protein
MVEVAGRLGLPALALRTGSAACFAGFLAYPVFCEKGYVPVQNGSCPGLQLFCFGACIVRIKLVRASIPPFLGSANAR